MKDPICNERGIPQPECPWHCSHGDIADAVICQCGELVGHAEHCEHCCGCGAASEHEHMAKVEHLRRCPICNTRFGLIAEHQWTALEMARKADAAERRAEEAEYHVEQLRDARDRAERRIEQVEALAGDWREDYPSDLAACSRTADQWWRDLHATLNVEGVGTGAGEGATGQDAGTAWVTRSVDCPEAPAQAHPLDRLRDLLDGDAALMRMAQAEALRTAARRFVEDMAEAWGGDAQWLTTGTRVAEVVACVLRDMAADLEADVCAHEWLDRPESDTRECLICGTEASG